MHGWHRALKLTRLLILAGVGSLLAGCLVPGPVPGAPRSDIDHYALLEGEARSVGGCHYRYRLFSPRPESPDSSLGSDAPAVLLGHGFLRSQGTLTLLARHLANQGYRAITLDFCNMKPWNGHHMRNAADMRSLRTLLGVERPVYAGFSAGALAALLAAADDPDTAGVVVLDPVDQQSMGADAIDLLNAPVHALFGEPSSCNAFNAMQGTIAAAPVHTISRIKGASHCEFEAPSNWLCETFCGDGRSDPGSDAVQRARIIESTLRAVQAIANPEQAP